jgi:hypothetical protein
MITGAEGVQWLARINHQRQYVMLADWAEQCKAAGRMIPLPRELDAHRLDAFQESESGERL